MVFHNLFQMNLENYNVNKIIYTVYEHLDTMTELTNTDIFIFLTLRFVGLETQLTTANKIVLLAIFLIYIYFIAK